MALCLCQNHNTFWYLIMLDYRWEDEPDLPCEIEIKESKLIIYD